MSNTNLENTFKVEKHLYHLEDNIIVWKDVKEPQLYSTERILARYHELTEPIDNVLLLLDLSISNKPPAEVRELMKEELIPVIHKIDHVAVYSGKNLLINISLRFVMAQMGLGSYSIHSNEDSALNKLRNEV